jgi:voltage-dependent calcium channel N type alpha-1B
LQAFLTLFIISNGEGWPNNLRVWMDSFDVDKGPVINYSVTEAIVFFILFLMIGQFFFINFFVGVLFMKFEEARSQEEKGYTKANLNWMDI